MSNTNQFGQIVGDSVPNWKGSSLPEDVVLTGRTCRIERLNVAKHSDDLFEAYGHSHPRDFQYTRIGPLATLEEHRKWAEASANSVSERHYAIIDLATNKAVGTIALMHIDATNGVIEVGYVRFSALLKRSTLSTEAQYLLMAYVFDKLGYRRYEWTCDNLNVPSRNAAERLGFTLEAVFRKHKVIHGRNFDTACFAIIDDEWPALKKAFQMYLAPENFNDQGKQNKSLKECREK